MTITIDPKLEARLRERAEAEGLTVPAYLERLVQADQTAEEELESLLRMAQKLGIDCLVEVHDESELDLALSCGADLVGVNQRDLRTFEVDGDLACRLAAMIPDEVTAVAESGIRGPDDVSRLAGCGFQAVLVGELLVTAEDPATAVNALTGHRVGPRGAPRAMASG